MDSDTCMHESDTKRIRLIDWCLMPTLAVFQLYRGVKKFKIKKCKNKVRY
jgi:hypothetical protein